jgi:glycosyltransferase involved in cell wall biosynthesis
MRIAINIRLWLPERMDGIGWFTKQMVTRMVSSHPEHEFFLLCDRKVVLDWELPKNAHQVVLFPPARHPFLWYLFFEWSVAPMLKRLKADLFLSTDGWMSLRTKVPTLTVIHDINYEHAVDYLRPLYQWYMKYFFPRFAHKAVRVATVSQYSKQDIAKMYHLSQDKIDVVYSGLNAGYHPLDSAEQQEVRQRYTGGKLYFIFVGSITKRKNLTNVIKAFDLFKQSDSMEIKLVVVGARVCWDEDLKNAYDSMQHQEDVIFLGRVENDVVVKLLASALALTYVSYFEGFGLPILEAFQTKTPVVTGNCTSMPEVAGDAAILVDPNNIEQIENALISLAKDEELRNTLIARGSNRVDYFSWDRTAVLLWQSLMQTYKDVCKKD